MILYYVTVALRHLKKSIWFSSINLIGLTVGLAACIMLCLYLAHELSFDRFHEKAERMYRIVEHQSSGDTMERLAAHTAGPLADHLKSKSDIESATQVRRLGRYTITVGDNRFYEGDYLFADPTFFEVFDFPMRSGNPSLSLSEPLSVVLTPESALRYFGHTDVVGRFLSVESFGLVKVTGLLQTLPGNSHLQFSMLFSISSIQDQRFKKFKESWESGGFITYAVAREGVNINTLEKDVLNIINEKIGHTNKRRTIQLQPLTDIHLYSSAIESDRNFQKSDPQYLYLFSAIALFILIIATINYINLSTARSLHRAREVGVRKSVGARLPQLIGQFVSESVLLVFIAMIFACGLVELFVTHFSALIGKPISFSVFNNPFLIALIILFTLTVGLLSGAYPAFHLSRLNVIHIFKGYSRSSKHERGIRAGLVVGQFTLSIVMIVTTIAAYRQLTYIREKNLGFESEHLVVIDINSGEVRKHLVGMKSQFASHSSVKSVSVTSRVPGEWKDIPEVEAYSPGVTQSVKTAFIASDMDFLHTFGVQLIRGRNFSDAMGTDSFSVIINETAAKAWGWDEPIGQRIRVPDRQFEATIVGVVGDFHFRSLHDKIQPLIIGFLSPLGEHPIDRSDYFSVRFTADNMNDLMLHLRQVGEKYDPEHPFEYNFLNEKLASFYQEDERIGNIFIVSAAFTIFISCLGLFSLSSFSAEQRRKEIGIRKVMGAHTHRLVFFLAKDFLKLVVFAILVAVPIAYAVLVYWLSNFAYRIGIEPDLFISGGLIALGIAWVTVAYQAYRAASANPVDALKYE
ncbi:ABC transporter permease [bacterium]|nr:ABC transporter permease [bacterium]NUN45438.1 ABC transporter permease [bacterium]